MKAYSFSFGVQQDDAINKAIQDSFAIKRIDYESVYFPKAKNQPEARNMLREYILENHMGKDIVIIVDRDIILLDIDTSFGFYRIPYGVIGVFGIDKMLEFKDSELKVYLNHPNPGLYKINSNIASVDISRPIFATQIMRVGTLRDAGEFDVRFKTDENQIGVEDSDWIIQARIHGMEFVNLAPCAKFGHIEHRYEEFRSEKELEKWRRRCKGGHKVLRLKYGNAYHSVINKPVDFGDYAIAQENSLYFKKYLQELRLYDERV